MKKSIALTSGIVTEKNWWSKRENDWYEIEERLIFKNNIENATDGDPSNISEWIKAIQK